MRWLALDVGSRRVGMAVCDADERVATALRPLPFAGAAALASAVAAVVAELGVEGIVVGMPVTRAGSGRGEIRAGAVAEALRQVAGVPVVTEDERGTTLEAEQLLREAGVPRRRWESLVDGLAATLILESHLAGRRRA
jgi:putative holliday junction resolvase